MNIVDVTSDYTSDQLTVEIRSAVLLLQSDFCLLQSTYFE